MKRLTMRNSDGTVSQPYGVTIEEVFYRLSEYEDTGLEPEEINELCTDDVAEVAKMFRKMIESGEINHLQDLLQAEHDGRIAVLPCKVGDAVYWMHDGVITECYINRVQINRNGVFIHIKSKKDKVPHGAFNAKINIGKTVFLTREEAEAAIAETGGNQ